MTPPSLRSGFVPLRGCLAVVCVVVRSFRGLPQARGGLRPCVLGLPPPRNYARALFNYRGGGFDTAPIGERRRCASRRGAHFPRSPFRSRGPNSPRLPAAYGRRAVVGASPLRFLVGFAAPFRLRPAVSAFRHRPFVPLRALRPFASASPPRPQSVWGGSASPSGGSRRRFSN